MANTVALKDNENVVRVISLLRKNNMGKEQQTLESLIKQISQMEKQFNMVVGELQGVKAQLHTIQNKGVRATTARVISSVETKIDTVKTGLNTIKANVIKSCSNLLESVKEKGVSALKKGLDFLGVRSALIGLQGKLKDSINSIHIASSRIESMKGELHSGKSHLQNAGRALLGKKPKEVTAPSDKGILSGIQNILGKTRTLLSGIGQKSIAAVEKIDGIGQRDKKPSVDTNLSNIKKAQKVTVRKVNPKDKQR